MAAGEKGGAFARAVGAVGRKARGSSGPPPIGRVIGEARRHSGRPGHAVGARPDQARTAPRRQARARPFRARPFARGAPCGRCFRSCMAPQCARVGVWGRPLPVLPPVFSQEGRCSALASIMQRSTSPRVGRVGACHTGLLFPAVCGRRCSAGSFGLAACHILNCRGQGTPGSGAAVANRAQCGSSNRSRSGAHRRWLERGADCRQGDPGPFQGVRRSGGAPIPQRSIFQAVLRGAAGGSGYHSGPFAGGAAPWRAGLPGASLAAGVPGLRPGLRPSARNLVPRTPRGMSLARGRCWPAGDSIALLHASSWPRAKVIPRAVFRALAAFSDLRGA